MKFIRPTHAIILALVLTVGIAGMLPASAAEGIERTELSWADLSGVEGVEVIVSFQRLQPGARMARHINYGDETVYVLKGGESGNSRRQNHSRRNRVNLTKYSRSSAWRLYGCR